MHIKLIIAFVKSGTVENGTFTGNRQEQQEKQ
jgi:hypothetical protein